jgi:hypothetical protein
VSEVEDPTLLFDPEPDPARRKRRARRRRADPDPARRKRRRARRRRYDPEPVRRITRRIGFGGFNLRDMITNLAGAFIVGYLAKKYPGVWIKTPIPYPPTGTNYEIPATTLAVGVALPLFFKRGILNDLGNKILTHNLVPLVYGYAGWRMSGSPVWGQGLGYPEKVEERKTFEVGSVQVPEVWR